jgi:hypothetical protein
MRKISTRCSKNRRFRPLLEALERRELLDGVSFLDPLDTAAGLNPSSTAVGDVNRDGKPDLVVANRISNNVSVLLGNGDGTFKGAVNYNTGLQPVFVAVGDFNGDGKLDIVTANFGSNNVSVLLGNGDGTFKAAVNYNTGLQPDAVAVGDFRHDGKLDLAVANSGGNNVSVLLGNGDGTFQKALNFTTGTSPASVAVGDFNGDGKLDLAVANRGTTSVSVLLGNGDGTFQQAQSFLTGVEPVSVVVGDFNGDGKLDLVTANFGSNNVSVLLGNGNGTLQSPLSFDAGIHPTSVAVADFNGDGKPDLAVANRDRNNVSVLLGNGNGTFQDHQDFATGTNPVSVATGNFKGGGKPDLVTANFGGNTASVLLNGMVTLTWNNPANIIYGTPLGPTQLNATADVPGTFVYSPPAGTVLNPGPNQVLSVQFTPSYPNAKAVPKTVTITVDKATPTITWNNPANITYGRPLGPTQLNATADVPGTFVYSPPAGTILNAGPNQVLSVTFAPADSTHYQPATKTVTITVDKVTPTITWNNPANITYGTPLGPTQLNATANVPGTFTYTPPAGAILGGGLNQVLSVTLTPADSTNYKPAAKTVTITVLSSAPAGAFQAAQNYSTAAFPSSVAVGDFDRDGTPDLVVANQNDGTVSVLLGKGDGTFQAAGSYAAGPQPASVAVGDFNGDGILDLAVASWGVGLPAGKVTILLGKGDGTFQAAQSYPTSDSFPQSLVVADFNRDGHLDFAVANSISNTVSVFLGNGDGTFQAAHNYDTGIEPVSVAVGDFKGDGVLDLVVANRNDSSVSVFLGKGDGSFNDGQKYPVSKDLSNFPVAVAVSDFNGDGIPDLAVVQFNIITVNTGNVSILLGKGDGTFQAAQEYPVDSGIPNNAVVGDFNGDGIPDLAIVKQASLRDNTGTVSILLGKGNGTFANAQNYPTGLRPASVAVGDFNGDGTVDLAIANSLDFHFGVGVLLNRFVTTTAVTGPASSTLGQPVTFTATVGLAPPVATPVAAGTVTFLDGTTPLGDPVPLNANGQASFSTSTLSTGGHTIQAKYNGTASGARTTGYGSSTGTTTLTVHTDTPTITWNNPANITYGTPLGAAQLNATADVPGTFVYTPPAGTVLNAGPNQVLTVTFTPSGATGLTPPTFTKQVTITVDPAPLTVTADATRWYGRPDSTATVTATYKGLVNGDTETTIGGPPKVQSNTTDHDPPGQYSFTPYGLTTSNYRITYVNGTLTVIPATMTAFLSPNIDAVTGKPQSYRLTYVDKVDPEDPPGSADAYTATIDWGDHTTSAGTVVVQDPPNYYDVYGGSDHSYAKPGTYTVTVTVSHKLGYTTTAVATGTAHVTSPLKLGGPPVPPVPPEQAFVQELYRQLLGREAEPQGLKDWTAILQAGGTRLRVVQGVWTSAEHRGRQVDQFYAAYLHRKADPAGRAFWVNALQGGRSETDVADAFLTSDEYLRAHPDLTAYLTGLYADVLGRSPSAAELASWQRTAQGGMSRATMADAFLESREENQELVDRYYADDLGRLEDPTGAAAWVEALATHRLTPALVDEMFLASDEFFAHAQKTA